MALTEADRAEIAATIAESVRSLVGGSTLAKCTAIYPHTGRMRYEGKGSYTCECGQRYRKDGAGGLVERPS